MQQLPLGVRIPDRAVFASFLPASNREAVEHAARVASGAAVGVTWLCGPPSTGKTHLLQAVCAAAGAGHAGYFPLTELAQLGVGVLEGLVSLECICIDDLDCVVPAAPAGDFLAGRSVRDSLADRSVVGQQLEWERALFAVVRETLEREARLVVTAKSPPALLGWKLPDLGSRFAAAAIFQLHELDEPERQEALQLHARLRGVELPDETARWLQRRFPRDMRTMCELLDTLDEAALVAQRRLTVPFIRSVLKE